MKLVITLGSLLQFEFVVPRCDRWDIWTQLLRSESTYTVCLNISFSGVMCRSLVEYLQKMPARNPQGWLVELSTWFHGVMIFTPSQCSDTAPPTHPCVLRVCLL